MAALTRLQEKIEQLRADHVETKKQNSDLKQQLAELLEVQTTSESLRLEVDDKKAQCKILEEKVSMLTYELEEKDNEIEKIIAQVESLLE